MLGACGDSGGGTTKGEITNIELDIANGKLSYFYNEPLDISGLKLIAVYSSGKSDIVDISANAISGFNSQTLGRQTLTVSHTSKTTSFDISVVKGELSTIVLNTANTKLQYFYGEAFDITSFTAQAMYASGYQEPIPINTIDFTGYSSQTLGKQTLTYNHANKTTNFDINVVKGELNAIELNTGNAKRNYFYGEAFDITGITAQAIYTSGYQEPIVINAVDFKGYSSQTIGSQTLSLAYADKVAYFDISIEEDELSLLTVNDTDSKLVYEYRSELFNADIIINATYKSGYVESIPIGADAVSGFNSAELGMQSLTLNHGGLTTRLDIEVIPGNATGIELDLSNTKIVYQYGDLLDVSELSAQLVYANDLKVDIVVSAEAVSGFDSRNVGVQTLTFNRMGQATNFNVELLASTLARIELDTSKVKLAYEKREPFDSNGLKVWAVYVNGNELEISDDNDVEISGYDDKHGSQRIIVNYNGVLADYYIELSAFLYSTVDDGIKIKGFTTSTNTSKLVIPPTYKGAVVVEVGSHAFRDKHLNEVILPEGLKVIGQGAFANNAISNIVIPSTVTKIESEVFSENELISLVIPEGCTEIGKAAFVKNRLEDVTIPQSVIKIEQMAFNLNKINLLNGEPSQGLIYAKDENGDWDNATIVSYGGYEKDVDFILDGTTTIGEKAFCNTELNSLFLPDNVTVIGHYAFQNNNLSHVELHAGIEDIGSFAFADNQLTSVSLSDNINSFWGGAFNNNQITEVNSELSTGIFYARNSSGLDSFIIASYGGAAKNIDFIPAQVTRIFYHAFYGSQLSSVQLPEGIAQIDTGAFQNNNLTHITLPFSLRKLGSSSFSSNKLTSLVIADGLTEIGQRAFSLNKLANVIIPRSVQSIGSAAFGGNTNEFTDDKVKLYGNSSVIQAYVATFWSGVVYAGDAP